MADLKTAYLSLGSNLGDTLNNLQDAIFAIHKSAGEVLRVSPVYRSSSWGFESEDFMNICLSLKTSLPPLKLLQTLLAIETKLGRIRYKEEGYQPRSIDIDILYYENETLITESRLWGREVPNRALVNRWICKVIDLVNLPIVCGTGCQIQTRQIHP